MVKRDQKLVVKRTVTGLGLFAEEPIEAGKKIIEYVGPILTNEESNKKGGKYLMRLSSRLVIDGSPRTNTARFINHACKPNAEALISGKRVWIWSKRAIRAGEQITLDYGEEYFDDHIRPKGCKCEHCEKKGQWNGAGGRKG
jgi:uncharacterized protein